jgi:hypothetical protein
MLHSFLYSLTALGSRLVVFVAVGLLLIYPMSNQHRSADTLSTAHDFSQWPGSENITDIRITKASSQYQVHESKQILQMSSKNMEFAHIAHGTHVIDNHSQDIPNLFNAKTNTRSIWNKKLGRVERFEPRLVLLRLTSLEVETRIRALNLSRLSTSSSFSETRAWACDT